MRRTTRIPGYELTWESEDRDLLDVGEGNRERETGGSQVRITLNGKRYRIIRHLQTDEPLVYVKMRGGWSLAVREDERRAVLATTGQDGR